MSLQSRDNLFALSSALYDCVECYQTTVGCCKALQFAKELSTEEFQGWADLFVAILVVDVDKNKIKLSGLAVSRHNPIEGISADRIN